MRRTNICRLEINPRRFAFCVFSSSLGLAAVVLILVFYENRRWHQHIARAAPFVRLAGATALIGAAIWTVRLIWLTHKRRTLTTWWDPTKRADGRISWEQLRDLTIGCAQLDPLKHVPSSRERNWVSTGAPVFAASLILGCLVTSGLIFLANPHVPEFLASAANNEPTSANAAMNLSGNLTAILVLIAAGISIYFTNQQLRAKVRADNRQAWIAKLRTLIADVTALAADHATALPWRQQALRDRLVPARLELELLLNPSEFDHRLLMYLIQRLALLNRSDHTLIQDAENLRATIQATYKCEKQFQDEWHDILDNTKVGQLVSYIMRLSHVVLKREWERVKMTR